MTLAMSPIRRQEIPTGFPAAASEPRSTSWHPPRHREALLRGSDRLEEGSASCRLWDFRRAPPATDASLYCFRPLRSRRNLLPTQGKCSERYGGHHYGVYLDERSRERTRRVRP